MMALSAVKSRTILKRLLKPAHGQTGVKIHQPIGSREFSGFMPGEAALSLVLDVADALFQSSFLMISDQMVKTLALATILIGAKRP